MVTVPSNSRISQSSSSTNDRNWSSWLRSPRSPSGAPSRRNDSTLNLSVSSWYSCGRDWLTKLPVWTSISPSPSASAPSTSSLTVAITRPSVLPRQPTPSIWSRLVCDPLLRHPQRRYLTCQELALAVLLGLRFVPGAISRPQSYLTRYSSREGDPTLLSPLPSELVRQ